jgi:hypothetical protein
LQTTINSSKNDLAILSENLAEAGSFYESSLIQMPVRIFEFNLKFEIFIFLDKISY